MGQAPAPGAKVGTGTFRVRATAGTTDVVGHANLLPRWGEDILVMNVDPGGSAI